MKRAIFPALASVAFAAVQVNFSSTDSIRTAARRVAWELLTYYHGNETGKVIGVLPWPGPYYWWESGTMWGTLVDYWHYTGDDTYNGLVGQALLFQAAPTATPPNSFMSSNWTSQLGNDDQGLWAMAAMLAAETSLPSPNGAGVQWLTLAQNVFNTQAAPDRQDGSCGGGLRWQISESNNGYDYKNAISNGVFFNLGARLAKKTGNGTYASWAVKTWNWMNSTGILDATFAVYDGAHVEHDCKDVNKAEFSYNAAVFLQGAAFMYNYTNGSAIWQERVNGLLNHLTCNFFPAPDGIAVERFCEDNHGSAKCNNDMQAYKGFALRWMASTAQVAPFTQSTIYPILRVNAEAAVKTCSGTATGTACGFRWVNGTFDGNIGVGEQMSALAALSTLFYDGVNVLPPTNGSVGGVCTQGDSNPETPNAGNDGHPNGGHSSVGPGSGEPSSLPNSAANGAGALVFHLVTILAVLLAIL